MSSTPGSRPSTTAIIGWLIAAVVLIALAALVVLHAQAIWNSFFPPAAKSVEGQQIRDLYDLFWFGQGALNEPLVRRVLVLKVWHDVVDDGLGVAPFDPAVIVRDFDADKLPSEDIGLLTQPVEPSKWLAAVRARYGFVADLGTTEATVARCNPGDRWQVQQLTTALPSL